MNQPAYENAQWFISVRDLDTGEQLVSLNADKFVEPGSVVKTYSMGAGWQHFDRITASSRRSSATAGLSAAG